MELHSNVKMGSEISFFVVPCLFVDLTFRLSSKKEFLFGVRTKKGKEMGARLGDIKESVITNISGCIHNKLLYL